MRRRTGHALRKARDEHASDDELLFWRRIGRCLHGIATRKQGTFTCIEDCDEPIGR